MIENILDKIGYVTQQIMYLLFIIFVIILCLISFFTPFIGQFFLISILDDFIGFKKDYTSMGIFGIISLFQIIFWLMIWK